MYKMPPVVLERPKMSRAVWESLKSHILKERQRKKQELEQDAEVERQRKERERQLKQDSMTLSETKDQLQNLEIRLNDLKDEKHQLFTQLKSVLHDDDTRKKQIAHKENEIRLHQTYLQPGFQMGAGGHPPPMIFNPMLARNAALYQTVPPRLAQGSPQSGLLTPRYDAPPKRSRSPSPPQQPNYKFGPYKPPPQAIHPYPHKPPQLPMQYYHPPSSQPPPQMAARQHQQQSSGPAQHQQQQPQHGAIWSYTTTPHPSRSPQNNREEAPKHVPAGAVYIPPGQPLPRGYVLHQQIEHPSQSSKASEDGPKYYASPSHSLQIRPPHLSIHPSISQLQAPPQGPQSGGITSGFPMRTTPSSSYQGRPPSPHVVYTGQNSSGRGIPHGHPQQNLSPYAHALANSHPQVTISRYPLPHGMQQRERDPRD